MKLIIDNGNCYTKVGIFDECINLFYERIKNGDEHKIVDIIKNYKIESTVISSVIEENEHNIEELILPYAGKILKINHLTKLPFTNRYETPETLGKDRVAAVAGAQLLFPDKNLLVIDAGTAITYDLLIENEYIGGNIAPGLNMRLKALNYYTSKLPLVEIQPEKEFPGKNTKEAISSGVFFGMIFEIEGYINLCNKKFEKFLTIITGGDSNYFVEKIKNPIFAVPNLVLIGLNRILEYNEKIQ